MSERGRQSSDTADTRAASGSGRVSFLDQALWKRYAEATTLEGFVQAWIGLQCRSIGRVNCAVVLLGMPDEGACAPAAFWPDEAACGDSLRRMAEVIAEKRPLLREPQAAEDAGAPATSLVGYPILDGHLYGASPSSCRANPATTANGDPAATVWALAHRGDTAAGGWAGASGASDRVSVAFDLVGIVLEQDGSVAASNAAATELAKRLDCDLVSIGFASTRANPVEALSHAPATRQADESWSGSSERRWTRR